MGSQRSPSPTDLCQKAFIRGLADDVDEEALKRLCSKYGTVVDVHIAKDRETNASRGFAFVTFTSSTDCSKACEGLDEKEFHNNVLHLELATHSAKQGRGGFRGSFRGGGFRGGRGGGSPSRDGGFYRRGGASRGSWRGGRGSYEGGYRGGRRSDGFYGDERYARRSFERDPPHREYGGRYESGMDYRPPRQERDYPDRAEYGSYRGRDYGPGERDYPQSRGRDYPSYGARDYPPSRAERDYDAPPRRYSQREYLDDYPSYGGGYEGRSGRRDFDGPPPREYGGAGRYDNYESNGRGGGYKSGRGSYLAPRDADYGRGPPPRRLPPRDDDHGGPPPRRPTQRSFEGPPPKKMKMDEPMRRSPRGGGAPRRF